MHANFFKEPDITDKIIVIFNRIDCFYGWLSKKQGLFSEFFSVLGALYYAEQHKAAGVYVKFDSDLYLDPEKGDNWWAYFFEPKMMLCEDKNYFKEIKFNKYFYRFGPYAWNESWSNVIIPNNTKLSPYPINSENEMKKINELVSKFIKVEQGIQEKVSDFFNKYMKGFFIIGMHLRGTDKKVLYPYSTPSYQLYDQCLQQVIKKYSPDQFKIFIATDEIDFIKWAKVQYSDKVLNWAKSPRLSAKDPVASKHGTHKSKNFSNFIKGESAIIDCLLLSYCDYLIKNRSSLSDIAIAFKPDMEWAFILDENNIIFSNDSNDKEICLKKEKII